MANMEPFSIQEAEERGISCKSGKWYPIALLLATIIMAVVLLVLISVSVAHQFQFPQEGPPAVAPSARTTDVPLVVVTGTATKQESTSSIYFATEGGDLKAYSLETSHVSTVGITGESLHGVAYDFMANKIYFCSYSMIHRADPEGTNLETVLSTIQYGRIEAMTFDWIAGNLYVVTRDNYILACNSRANRAFQCATVLNDAGYFQGIALNPIQGVMFYTNYQPTGSIMRAGMDGSNIGLIISGLGDPFGITIDFKTSRLFWADMNNNKIETSNFEGSDRRNNCSSSKCRPLWDGSCRWEHILGRVQRQEVKKWHSDRREHRYPAY